jgi:hypothetical protein
MKNPRYKIADGTADKLIKAGVLVVAFFVGKKLLKNAAQNSADDQIDTDPAAGQARALNAAMNPSGVNWMRTFDTTNTAAIYDIAPQITNLDKVKDYYKAQTQGRILHEDLINELGAEGYNKFLALATKGKSGSIKYSPVRTDIPANKWVITKAEANIRKTPIYINKYLPNNNILKLVPSGKALGITTGKFAYDQSSDVTFIEFYTLGTKVAGKHYFYVANSQVELLTKEEKAKREKAGKIPLELLAGFSGVEQFTTQAVSIHTMLIYDEEFKAIASIPKNIIIGFPLLTLDTGKGKRIKLQTVQGSIRWVNADDVQIQRRSS